MSICFLKYEIEEYIKVNFQKNEELKENDNSEDEAENILEDTTLDSKKKERRRNEFQ